MSESENTKQVKLGSQENGLITDATANILIAILLVGFATFIYFSP